jgi:hypothetical protein
MHQVGALVERQCLVASGPYHGIDHNAAVGSCCCYTYNAGYHCECDSVTRGLDQPSNLSDRQQPFVLIAEAPMQNSICLKPASLTAPGDVRILGG